MVSNALEERMVTLWALTPAIKPLQWENPYKGEHDPTRTGYYPQKVTEHGTKYYIVPEAYARRLISGEPHKYFLSEPYSIQVQMLRPGGYREPVNVFAKKEKIINGKAIKDQETGYTVLIDAPNPDLDPDEEFGEDANLV